MTDGLITTIAGVALTSLIALFVYNYKSMVTYSIISLYQRFHLQDGKISRSEESDLGISLSRITIINRGFKNAEPFTFHAETNADIIYAEVSHSNSLAKREVTIETEGSTLSISCQPFPRNEELHVDVATNRLPWFNDAKGNGKNYQLRPLDFYRGYTGARNISGALVIVAAFLYLLNRLAAIGGAH